MEEYFQKLSAPFLSDKVSWRVGSVTKDKKKAMALAYIDARDVMQRLDDAVGPANWQRSYTHAEKKTICAIGIRLDGEWVWKSDGAGDSDIEAEKGAISDAFKRAAVNWGIGRYLYDVQSPWVAINEYKQIESSELPKLRAVLDGKPVKETPSPSADDKAKLAKAFALKAVQSQDSAAFVQANYDKIIACTKYPEANQILVAAGLVEV